MLPVGTIVPRRPLHAALLSLCCPGLGQVYCGQIALGLGAMLASGALASIGTLALLPSSLAPGLRGVAAVACAACVAVWVWSVEASRRRARTLVDYELRDYNRPAVYAMLALSALPLAVVLAAMVRGHVVRPYAIPTASMEPSIPAGSRVLANLLAYDGAPICRGDVVVYTDPDQRGRTLIKRVVGLAGDTVELDGAVLRVNGVALVHEDSDVPTDRWERADGRWYRIRLDGAAGARLTATVVPRGHVFVLGDHRQSSVDSRQHGPVPLVDVLGRVDYAYFPRAGYVGPVER